MHGRARLPSVSVAVEKAASYLQSEIREILLYLLVQFSGAGTSQLKFSSYFGLRGSGMAAPGRSVDWIDDVTRKHKCQPRMRKT